MSLAVVRRRVERLERLAMSPGAVLDAYDADAVRAAAAMMRAELTRMEAQERARRSEDDTGRISPERPR